MASLNQPAFLRIDAVAETLSVSKRTVFEIIANGQLPACKLGGCTLIRRQDFDRYVASLPRVRTKFAA
jgi:excisionase family DNA binding protein